MRPDAGGTGSAEAGNGLVVAVEDLSTTVDNAPPSEWVIPGIRGSASSSPVSGALVLQALGRQEDVGDRRQRGRIGHDPDDPQHVRTDLQGVADMPAQCARRRDLVRPRPKLRRSR